MPNTLTAFIFPKHLNMETLILQIIPSGKFTYTLRKYNIFNLLKDNLSILTTDTRDAVRVTRMSLKVSTFLEGS